jgi:hypothetical protein
VEKGMTLNPRYTRSLSYSCLNTHLGGRGGGGGERAGGEGGGWKGQVGLDGMGLGVWWWQ